MNSVILKKTVKQIAKNFVNIQSMSFAAKKTTKPTSGSDIEADKTKKTIRGSNSSDETFNTQTESTFTQQATQSKAADGVKIIESVPDHKCPFSEDTVPGRYSQTAFITASQAGNLYRVYNDMLYIQDLYKQSYDFKTICDNSGLNSNQLYEISKTIGDAAGFCETTLAFLDLVGKNQRYMYINEIAKKYIQCYHLLSKEQKISIISAYELNDQEKSRVKEALHANPENAGKSFIVDFSVNSSIVGGLQMYSENKFMDLSLNSRIDKLKEEVNKLI